MGAKPRLAPVAHAPHTGFGVVLQRAQQRKGVDGLDQLLAEHPLPPPQSDDRVLSVMTKLVFSAGFVWKVVENKWPGFEAAFDNFEPMRVATYDAIKLDELASDPRIIRNRHKIAATVDNARFVVTIADEHGSFANWLASWPAEDPVGMWREVQKRGNRLGGFTGQRFLRHAGFDTFMLSGDVVKALIGAGIVSKKPTSQRDLRAVAEAFNAWRAESGRTLSELSRILAYSVD